MVNLVLEFDDLHFMPPEDCMETIDKYVKAYPDIKLSFFTIPLLRGFPLGSNPEWCARLKEHIDNGNVRLAVHGYYHTSEEFKMYEYTQSMTALTIAESIFRDADLPVLKVFRGPHWGLSEGALEALVKLNYTHLYNHEDYRELVKPFKDKVKVVYYNWNLAEDPPKRGILDAIAGKPVITHGHTHNVCGNGIEETFDKVCNFLDNNKVEFKFVDEV